MHSTKRGPPPRRQRVPTSAVGWPNDRIRKGPPRRRGPVPSEVLRGWLTYTAPEDRSRNAMSDHDAIDLLSLTPDALRAELSEHFGGRGQPTYRVEQVVRRIYDGLARSFEEMTELPALEREALTARYALAEPEEAQVALSADGTVKHLWRLADGEVVESVLIPTDRRLTLCISSQAGCAMACTFCATGWGGFSRQLTAGEIVSQYRA